MGGEVGIPGEGTEKVALLLFIPQLSLPLDLRALRPGRSLDSPRGSRSERTLSLNRLLHRSQATQTAQHIATIAEAGLGNQGHGKLPL